MERRRGFPGTENYGWPFPAGAVIFRDGDYVDGRKQKAGTGRDEKKIQSRNDSTRCGGIKQIKKHNTE